MTKQDKNTIHESVKIHDSVTILGYGSLNIGANSIIEPNVLIDLGRNGFVNIGIRSKLKCGCVIRTYEGGVSIGDRTTIGEYTVLAGHGGLSIGHMVIIAGHCYASASDHIFYADDPIRFQGETAEGIRINDGAWVGANVVMLDGISIGENTVIGAGSVVTRDMPKNMVCFGNPCRERRLRQ